MTKKVVIVVDDQQPKKRLARKWRWAVIGLLLCVGTLVVDATGLMPAGIFGIVFTVLAGLTFIALLDAIYGFMTGADQDEVVVRAGPSDANEAEESPVTFERTDKT